jgi:stress-induced morphogen
MATITRGSQDQLVQKIKSVLDQYEHHYEGSTASVYRQNSASVRIRIVDQRFDGLSIGQRHDAVWKFIADRLGQEELQEISVLLMLTPQEKLVSDMSSDFDHPIPSML